MRLFHSPYNHSYIHKSAYYHSEIYQLCLHCIYKLERELLA